MEILGQFRISRLCVSVGIAPSYCDDSDVNIRSQTVITIVGGALSQAIGRCGPLVINDAVVTNHDWNICSSISYVRVLVLYH